MNKMYPLRRLFMIEYIISLQQIELPSHNTYQILKSLYKKIFSI